MIKSIIAMNPLKLILLLLSLSTILLFVAGLDDDKKKEVPITSSAGSYDQICPKEKLSSNSLVRLVSNSIEYFVKKKNSEQQLALSSIDLTPLENTACDLNCESQLCSCMNLEFDPSSSSPENSYLNFCAHPQRSSHIHNGQQQNRVNSKLPKNNKTNINPHLLGECLRNYKLCKETNLASAPEEGGDSIGMASCTKILPEIGFSVSPMNCVNFACKFSSQLLLSPSSSSSSEIDIFYACGIHDDHHHDADKRNRNAKQLDGSPTTENPLSKLISNLISSVINSVLQSALQPPPPPPPGVPPTTRNPACQLVSDVIFSLIDSVVVSSEEAAGVTKPPTTTIASRPPHAAMTETRELTQSLTFVKKTTTIPPKTVISTTTVISSNSNNNNSGAASQNGEEDEQLLGMPKSTGTIVIAVVASVLGLLLLFFIYRRFWSKKTGQDEVDKNKNNKRNARGRGQRRGDDEEGGDQQELSSADDRSGDEYSDEMEERDDDDDEEGEEHQNDDEEEDDNFNEDGRRSGDRNNNEAFFKGLQKFLNLKGFFFFLKVK
jgi:hypothetical protein